MPIYFFACKKGDKFMEKQIIKVPSEEMAASIKVDLARLQYNAIKANNLRNERNAFLKMMGIQDTMDSINQRNMMKKSSELQTQFNAANKCFKDYASDFAEKYGVTIDANYREVAELNFADAFDIVIEQPEITQENADFYEDMQALGDSVNAMESEIAASELDYFGEDQKLSDAISQMTKTDEEYRKEAKDIMSQFMPEAEVKNVVSNEKYAELEENAKKGFVENLQDKFEGVSAIDIVKHPLASFATAIQGTKLETMISTLQTRDAYELAGMAYQSAYNTAMARGNQAISAGNVALDTVKDAAKDAAGYAAKELGELYKKAGEKYMSVLDRAKNFCKQVYLDVHKAFDVTMDFLTLGCHSKCAAAKAMKAFENVEICQKKVDDLSKTVANLKAQMQKEPSAGTRKLLHEAQAELIIAKAELNSSKAYNFACPYKNMDEAKAYWAEIGVKSFGVDKDGHSQSPAQKLEDTVKRCGEKIVEIKNNAIKSAKVFGYSVQCAAYDAKASIHLALERTCDKQINKIQSRINALKQVDQSISRTQAALDQARTELNGMINGSKDIQEKYTYKPSEKITGAIEKMEALKEKQGGTLNRIQQTRYDDLQNKLAKDVAKGQTKLDAQMDKDFAELSKRITHMEFDLYDLKAEKEKADKKIDALQEKLDAKEAKRSAQDEKFKAADSKAKEASENIKDLENDGPEME